MYDMHIPSVKPAQMTSAFNTFVTLTFVTWMTLAWVRCFRNTLIFFLILPLKMELLSGLI